MTAKKPGAGKSPWPKSAPPEKDLPENLKTKIIRPGDPGYPCAHEFESVAAYRKVEPISPEWRCRLCGVWKPIP